jgi:large subunit ribosomal protein L25
MEQIELRAQSRTIHGKQVKRLRADGWIPAVLFGAQIESRSIQVEEPTLSKALQQAGSTTLVSLLLDDETGPRPVLAREIQRDILSGRLRHVDFYQVQLDHKIKTTPALEIVGESPLVRAGGAVLVQILTHVEVECLPSDLIHSIPVDVSVLKRLDDSIAVGDLPVPNGVTILTHADDTVVSVVPPRAAIEEEVEEVEVPEVELGTARARAEEEEDEA